jgi:hypothetical protein
LVSLKGLLKREKKVMIIELSLKMDIILLLDQLICFLQKLFTEYYRNIDNTLASSQESIGNFRNGHVYLRASLHSINFLGKKKIDVTRKYFIDQSIGLNFDYNLFPGDTIYPSNLSSNIVKRDFYNPSVLQFHYSLSYGIRLNRAWMLIPGVSLPLLGIYEWSGFGSKIS